MKSFLAFFFLIVILCLAITGYMAVPEISSPHTLQKLTAMYYGGEFVDTAGVLFQSKKNNCGPTALKMIFNRYQINSSLEELEREVGMNENGSSMLALKKAGEHHGFIVEGWKLSSASLPAVGFPALLFIRGNHFVVADSVDQNDFLYVRDPSIGRIKYRLSSISKEWEGEILLFYQRYVKG